MEIEIRIVARRLSKILGVFGALLIVYGVAASSPVGLENGWHLVIVAFAVFFIPEYIDLIEKIRNN